MLALCIARALTTKKGKTKERQVTFVLLVVDLVLVLANLILAVSSSEWVCRVAYSIYFVTSDWLMYFFFVFSLEYSDYRIKRRYLLYLVCIVLLIDSVSLAVNTVTEHACEFTYAQTLTGEPHLTYVNKLPYNLHLALVYLIVLFSIFGFIHKIYNVAKVYRLKYQLLLYVLSFVICGYAVNFILDTVIDITAITCALGGIVIYFFAVEYISNALLLRMLSVVSQEMTDAVFIFDSMDRCIYENDSARKMLQKYGHARDDVKRLLYRLFLYTGGSHAEG